VNCLLLKKGEEIAKVLLLSHRQLKSHRNLIHLIVLIKDAQFILNLFPYLDPLLF
jgi:hypothetical protein